MEKKIFIIVNFFQMLFIIKADNFYIADFRNMISYSRNYCYNLNQSFSF